MSVSQNSNAAMWKYYVWLLDQVSGSKMTAQADIWYGECFSCFSLYFFTQSQWDVDLWFTTEPRTKNIQKNNKREHTQQYSLILGSINSYHETHGRVSQATGNCWGLYSHFISIISLGFKHLFSVVIGLHYFHGTILYVLLWNIQYVFVLTLSVLNVKES